MRQEKVIMAGQSTRTATGTIAAQGLRMNTSCVQCLRMRVNSVKPNSLNAKVAII